MIEAFVAFVMVIVPAIMAFAVHIIPRGPFRAAFGGLTVVTAVVAWILVTIQIGKGK